MEGSRGSKRNMQTCNGLHRVLTLLITASMTLTQYLGTGSVSRGRLTINSQLKTIVSKSPYLNDDNDKLAVIQGVDDLRDALNKVSSITWIKPTKSQSSTAFVNSVRNPTQPTLLALWLLTCRRFLLIPGRETPTIGSVRPPYARKGAGSIKQVNEMADISI